MRSDHHATADVVLALDASTSAASVAVLRGGAPVVERAAAMRGADEERLMPAVAAALADAGVPAGALSAIVCGGGPGSFTSLRIAGAIAKGLATVWDCALVAAPSLALAAAAVAPGVGRWLVVLDAMRGERYAAVVTLDVSGGAVPAVVGYDYLGVQPGDAIDTLATTHHALGILDANGGAATARGAAGFALALDARRLGPPGALALAPVDLALWEPDYGRKAEAQVKWEAQHGRELPAEAAGARAS
ncbi:MAG: tRNA (adenosine(37)-N6)-threonylcarbamoyltransferase complex dimerization subunit type 1 TsaB [Gemmatirosa sp.]